MKKDLSDYVNFVSYQNLLIKYKCNSKEIGTWIKVAENTPYGNSGILYSIYKSSNEHCSGRLMIDDRSYTPFVSKVIG